MVKKDILVTLFEPIWENLKVMKQFLVGSFKYACSVGFVLAGFVWIEEKIKHKGSK